MRFCQAVLSRHQTPQAAALSKLVQSLQLESVVDILGYVQESKAADARPTGGVELAVVRLTLLSRSKKGPFSVEDASRFIQNDFLKPDNAVETPHPAKPALKTSFVPTSLRQDYRVLDLRVPANIAIFRIESQISSSFRDFFLHRGFVEIHSPKLLPAVQPEQFGDFKLPYFGRDAKLAQNTIVHRLLAVQTGLGNVFEIGPAFRALPATTSRHLCEFTSLDFEMEIKESFEELIATFGELLRFIFSNVRLRNLEELSVLTETYPQDARDLLAEGLFSLSFEQAKDLLQIHSLHKFSTLEDFSVTEVKQLARLVREQHRVEVFLLHSLPDVCQPYTTMPQAEKEFACAFKVILRGEAVASGAQRCHDLSLLHQRAASKGINCNGLYSNLRFGAVPHGGVQFGLERLTASFLGLPNIRTASLFYRDSHRMAP